ncbi:RDD family protein [Candidatus Sororendozoicomonas aggregata]|uniref:RDD family protein n=1 Tax=Candidatus Sororendozoicomonas aggregata TaxID=3073239 RepID=UPI002ED1F251
MPLSIQPTQPPQSPQLPIAPLWRRLTALIYDTLLVVALFILTAFINLGIQLVYYGEPHLKQLTEDGHTLDNGGLYLALVAVTYAFFTYCWCRKGQTPGMKAWRVRLVTTQMQPVTLKSATIRWLAAIPSLLLCFAGTLWMVVDPQAKSWQDRASKTMIVVLPNLGACRN